MSNGALGVTTPLVEARPRCQPALLPLFSSPHSCRASERKGHGKAEARSRGGAKEKTLECGQIVWGLAFSAWPAAGGPDAAAGLSCLVLATGLNDGQIKVWEVQTGERCFMALGMWQQRVQAALFALSAPRLHPSLNISRG